MNERIQQLIEQCTDMVWPDGPYEREEFNKEKFAKLIVRECAKVLTQHGTYFSGEGEPYHYAANLIEEHFGVNNG